MASTDTKDPDAPAPGSQHAGGFDEKVFLTSINDPGTLAMDIPEAEGIGRVRHLHGQITGVVQTLNDKVTKVLQKQEREFLSAYRAHMYQVQKELQSLRAKANDAELQLKKNDKIRSLEDEKEWYRKEALRLDKFSTQLKNELKFMREKLEAIEEDRNWLERQLKTAKKSNKLLRAELELRMQDGGELPPSPGGGGGGIWAEEAPTPTATGASGTGMFPPPRRPSGQWQGDGRPSPPGSGRGPRSGRTEGSGRKTTQRSGTDASMMEMVSRLQSELAAERQTTKALRAATVAGQTDRGELEEFFLQCVDDVRKDISKRRMRALAAANSKARPRKAGGGGGGGGAGAGSVVDAHSTFDKDFAADKVKAKAQEPSLGDFTATDRRRVVERLLSDDYVLDSLYHLIFDAGAGPGGAEGDEDAGGETPSADGSGEFVGIAVPGVGDVPEDDGGDHRPRRVDGLKPSYISDPK